MKIKAKEFDKKFDEGGDISKYLDVSKAKPYQVKQVRTLILKYKLELEEEHEE